MMEGAESYFKILTPPTFTFPFCQPPAVDPSSVHLIYDIIFSTVLYLTAILYLVLKLT